MDLLHDLSIDAISDSKEPVAVDPVQGIRQDFGDTLDEASLVTIKRMTWAHERNRAPCAAPSSHRSNQHVALNRRMPVLDEASQDIEIPIPPLWKREQQVGCLMPWTQRSDAPVGGLKEVVRIAKRLTERFVRLAGVSQVSGQVVDEFERSEFPLDLEHAA
jgi:hypothetical protein